MGRCLNLFHTFCSLSTNFISFLPVLESSIISLQSTWVIPKMALDVLESMYSLTGDVFCFHTCLNKSFIFCIISIKLWKNEIISPFMRYEDQAPQWELNHTSPEHKVSQTWLPQTLILRQLRKMAASFPFFGRNEGKLIFPVTAVYVTVLWRDCAEGRLAWLCSEMEVTCWLVSH